ncbi:MAG: LolA family protein [bacterium]
MLLIMEREKFFNLLCLIVVTIPAFSQVGSSWVDLRQKYLGLKSLSGSFTETVVSGVDGETTLFVGKFFFQMPSRFRLEVTEPMRQLIVGNDSVVWFYFPDEKRAVLQKRRDPFPLLAFVEPLLDTASSINEEKLPDGRKVLLVQSDEGSVFRDMRLELDGSGLRVNAFSFLDDWGNSCRFVLKNQRWNQPLAPKLFKFVPPTGTQIEYQ